MKKHKIIIFAIIVIFCLGCYNLDESNNSKNNPVGVGRASIFLYNKSSFNEIDFQYNYKGKTIYMTGRIQRIRASGEVIFNKYGFHKQLVCKFNNLEQLTTINAAKKILFSGRVSHVIHGGYVYLDNCEMLEI